jgi:hypothetical protein
VPDRLQAAEREKLARRFDKSARLAAIGLTPTLLVAVVDLATGALIDDRRLDLVLLASAGLGLSGAVSLRGFARRVRNDALPRESSPGLWARTAISILASVGVSSAIGYLVGGTVLAVAVPLALLLLSGVPVAIGLRRHRRMSDR